MANFYFKKFVIKQSDSAMKVNTDGVLLPAWVSLPSEQNYSQSSNEGSLFKVLDIGSGTGVVSLILAQRLEEELFKTTPNSIDKSNLGFSITAIDVDKDSYLETKYNFENSIWREQLEALHISLQDYCAEQKVKLDRFDLILSNPPFFTNSLNAPSHKRNIARHNCALPLEALLNSSALLLTKRGILAVILPIAEGETLLEMVSKSNQFEIKRVCKVKTLLKRPAKRYMIELSRSQTLKSEQIIAGNKNKLLREETLVMQKEGGEFYTNQYNELVKRFYSKEFKIKSI
ncbi:MAG: methyltransferase [Bacteroidales bacterium]